MRGMTLRDVQDELDGIPPALWVLYFQVRFLIPGLAKNFTKSEKR
jgi:hypothetical protein